MESDIFKKGIAKRRKVLGDEYVDKALASADELGADMQKLVTEYAWGEVWNKENLRSRVRPRNAVSCLVPITRLAVYAAAGLVSSLSMCLGVQSWGFQREHISDVLTFRSHGHSSSRERF